MKSYFYFFLFVITLSIPTGVAARNLSEGLSTQQLQGTFTLEEAKAIFLQTLEKNGLRESITNTSGFSPGRYTLAWDEAFLSENNHLYCYNVPIYAENRYRAKISYTNREYFAPVSQKLIIIKSKKKLHTSVNLMTLIPSEHQFKEYRYKFSKNHNFPADIHKFSGFSITHNPMTGKVTSAILYFNGRPKHIAVLSNPKYSSNKELLQKRDKILSMIKLEKMVKEEGKQPYFTPIKN